MIQHLNWYYSGIEISYFSFFPEFSRKCASAKCGPWGRKREQQEQEKKSIWGCKEEKCCEICEVTTKGTREVYVF